MLSEYLDTAIGFSVILLAASLIITILSQIISSLLGYRGTNLLWGVSTLIETLEPGLEKKATESLAREVLTLPMLSDSIFSRFGSDSWLRRRWKLASAVGPKALVNGLKKLEEKKRATKGKNHEHIEADKEVADTIQRLLAVEPPEVKRKAQEVQAVLKAPAPDYAVQVEEIARKLETSVSVPIGKLETWYDTIMKRTAQRFAMQIRLWTIAFALILAFAAHLDAFNILYQLWTTPMLRAGLIQIAPDLLKEAPSILADQSGTAQPTEPISPLVLGDAMEKLAANEKASMKGLRPFPTFNSLDEAVKWLREKPEADDSRKVILIDEYKYLVLEHHIDRIRQQLTGTGFRIIPNSLNFHYDGLKNIMGILAFAGLTSLGAPFWFNSLKNLANLRTMVSIRQDEQQQK